MWQLNANINLIVCQKSKVDDWVNHMRTEYDLPYVIVCDLTKKDEYEMFFSAIENPYLMTVGVINYDLVFRRKELETLRDFTLMLDESQFIQNETAKRTKFILKMKPLFVILLSGTPVGGKYEQLWTQCQLLGWRISKTKFWNDYINYRLYRPAPTVYPIKIVTGYKNVDDLKKKLAEHGAHFLKTEEVIDLPEQVFTTISVPSSPEYRKFMKDKIVTIEGETLVGDNPLKKLLYARQLCSTYSDAKLTAFKDWVESNNDRLVIFYNFNSELDKMLSVVGDRPVSLVNGATKDLTAYEEEPDSITFVNYGAGSSGLNLWKANYMMLYSPPLSVMNFMQCLKRVHRIGQTKTCFYYYPTVKDSIEEKIYDALKRGEDYTNLLFERDFKEPK